MGRDQKAQVGARVPGDLLERAKNAAVSLGVSFNSWVEQAFNLKLGENTEPPQPIPGQTSILDAERQERRAEAQAIIQAAADAFGDPHDPPPAKETPVSAPRFDRTCKNGTLHWRHGPGNPCKFCGGEI